MNTARLVHGIGRIPVLGKTLRRIVNRYREGSTVTIRRGQAAGMRFKRFHRYNAAFAVGVHEIPLQEAIARELSDGAVFYDVGSHTGFFTAIAARIVGPRGFCYAFDPVPDNVDATRAQIEVNDLGNCEVVGAGVCDRNDKIEFIQSDSYSTVQMVELGRLSAGKKFVVPTVTLDSFVANHRPPDVVKIDVEGAEVHVLEGAKGLLGSEHAPCLIIELHGDELACEVAEILERNRYAIHDLERKLIAKRDPLPNHILALRNPQFS